ACSRVAWWTVFPYTTLFRSRLAVTENVTAGSDLVRNSGEVLRKHGGLQNRRSGFDSPHPGLVPASGYGLGTVLTTPEQVRCKRKDRKSTRLNSSHVKISYAV